MQLLQPQPERREERSRKVRALSLLPSSSWFRWSLLPCHVFGGKEEKIPESVEGKEKGENGKKKNAMQRSCV
jgi:hypothetical protein